MDFLCSPILLRTELMKCLRRSFHWDAATQCVIADFSNGFTEIHDKTLNVQSEGVESGKFCGLVNISVTAGIKQGLFYWLMN